MNNKVNVHDRISIDDYFMKIVEVVKLRSTCLRHQIGCVIIKNDKIVSTGYNGAVKGARHCIDIGCIRDKMNIKSGTRVEICEAVHAEQNALIQAGDRAIGGTLYVNCTPCKTCTKMLINAGIKRVVIPYNDDYPDKDGLKILKELEIEYSTYVINNI